MNIQNIEIGQVVRDQDGVEYMVMGLDCVGLPRKPGPLVVLGQIGAFCEYRHVNAKELEGFQWRVCEKICKVLERGKFSTGDAGEEVSE